MKRWIILTNPTGGPFYCDIDCINGMERDESAYCGAVTYIYIWPCIKGVKETPEEIMKLIADQEPVY